MKKYLLLFASAALLLVGCAKEKFAEPIDGGLTNVTFTASLENGVATKATVDGDGAAANVNRCIMEIYYGGERYTRQYAPVNDQKKATFTIQVVSNRKYKVAFWADCVDNAGDLATDKYYITNAEGGLQAITINGDYIGNDDVRDAFYHVGEYTVAQAGTSFGTTEAPILLKRPFAQMNVITTDWDKVATVAALAPEKVNVTIKNPLVKFNAVTGIASADAGTLTLNYTADVYDAPAPTGTAPANEKTLSMDYLFASTTKEMIDIDWKALHGEDTPVAHSFAAVPYQRNYRTNIKGALLTTQGQWTVEVDPIWESDAHGEYEKLVVATTVLDIEGMNTFVTNHPDADQIDVTFSAEPNDAGNPSVDANTNAIVTSTLKENSDLNVTVASDTKTLYVGDFKSEKDITVVETSKAAKVNITVPQGKKIETLVINAPFKSVYLNGQQISGGVGTLTNVEATTSEHTLVVDAGQSIGTLTVHQGGLEIHGTVETLVINENNHDNNPVKVRTSENLSLAVFDVIKGETPTAHDYIDRPDYSERQNANGTWNIVPSVCKITPTDKAYGSVADAFAAVENGQTIVMLQNDVLTKGQTIALEDNEAFTLDLNGKTISIAETGFDFTANGTNVALRSGIPVRFAIVINGNGTMTICDNSADKLGRLESKDYGYGTTKTILVDGNAIVNINGGTIAGDYAAFYVVGYTATGAVPANAPKPTLNVNGGKILGQKNGIGIKGNTATLKVTGGEIVGNEYYGVSTNGTQDWYDGGKFAIEITGGLIKSVDGNAMYLPAEGPTVITGGTLEGATGIAVKGGSLSISSDVIVKANGPYAEAKSVSSGNANTGSAIYVEDTYADHSPIVNISGGKFSSENNKAVEYYTTKADDVADKGKITLTGGIYSDAPDASFVAEGYAVLDNTDADTKAEYPKTVKVKPVVKIGNVEYADIADAFAAITTSTPTTVTLLENIGSKNGDEIVWKEYDRVYVYTINKDQNVTFDLNGHKIFAKTTVNGETCFFRVENGGTLTIKDSSEEGELNYLDGNDDTGGFVICSAGNLTIESGTIENHTECENSAIQGAIDVHANEWGTPYAHHVTFTMNGGVLKSHTDNTLRLYDSSQTGTGGVVIDSEINGGEIYGADAVFIMTQWIAGPEHVSNDTHMNNINLSVKGGKFDTKNGIRVVGNVGEENKKDYAAIKINVSGGEFTIRTNTKYRKDNVAYQVSAGNWESTEQATANLRSYTEVHWAETVVPTYMNE